MPDRLLRRYATLHELRNVQQGGHHSALHEGFLGISPYVLQRSIVVFDKQTVCRVVAPFGKPFLKALAENTAGIDDGVLHVRVGGYLLRKARYEIVRKAARADRFPADLAETGGDGFRRQLDSADGRCIGHCLVVVNAVRLCVLISASGGGGERSGGGQNPSDGVSALCGLSRAERGEPSPGKVSRCGNGDRRCHASERLIELVVLPGLLVHIELLCDPLGFLIVSLAPVHGLFERLVLVFLAGLFQNVLIENLVACGVLIPLCDVVLCLLVEVIEVVYAVSCREQHAARNAS